MLANNLIVKLLNICVKTAHYSDRIDKSIEYILAVLLAILATMARRDLIY